VEGALVVRQIAFVAVVIAFFLISFRQLKCWFFDVPPRSRHMLPHSHKRHSSWSNMTR
jgi:hypothetical protein